jgi:hypothetical protein
VICAFVYHSLFSSVESLILGGLRGMGNEDDPAEVSRAAVEAANVLKVDKKNRKLERLKCYKESGCWRRPDARDRVRE